MRILYIANGNGMNPGMGGSLNRTIEIAKRVGQLGCKIHFLTTKGGYRAARVKGLVANYHILPASIFKQEEVGFLDRAFAYVISTIAAFWIVPKLPECDLVYTDSDYFCDTIPAVLYKRTKDAMWVAMTHHRIKVTKRKIKDFLISFVSSYIQSFSYFLFSKYADRIFVYKSDMGRSLENQMTSKGISSSKIERVTNGVDVNFIESIHADKKIYDVSFVGGLRPSKGLYNIVPIWKEVVKKKEDSTLIVVGGGLKEYETELRTQIRMEGLESQIIIAGAKEYDETIKTMKMTRVFISPSNEEGWGTAVCEAMISRLPVVAYDLPTYKEVFGEEIRKVPFGSISDFAEAILEFLSDEDLMNEYGLRGYNFASQYDWDLVAKNELNLFEKTLEGR